MKNSEPTESSEAAAFLAADGPLAQDGHPWRVRDEQLRYTIAVERLIETNSVGLVEGGTGVGKTLGYLVPHILAAKRQNVRVLVATRTKNLQDQIFLKDLPRLAKLLDFRYAILKGRENYVCSERLRLALEEQDLFHRDPYARALKYLHRFNQLHVTGDLEAAQTFLLRYAEDGYRATRDARATDDTCLPDHRYLCRHFKALAEAERADVIIANHHLALLWPESYPKVDRLVIDEAHALEEAATDAFGMGFSPAFILNRLRRIYRPSSRLSILNRFSKRDAQEFGIEKLMLRVRALRDGTVAYDDLLREFARRRDSARFRIRDAELTEPGWQDLCQTGKNLAEEMDRLGREMNRAFESLRDVPRLSTLGERIKRAGEGLRALGAETTHVFSEAAVEGTVLWVDASPNRPPVFRRSPLHVGEALREKLYARFSSVLLTSATLQTGGSFQFLSERLGLTGAAHTDEDLSLLTEDEFEMRVSNPVSVGHPFDYKSNVLLCILRDERTLEGAQTARRIEAIAQRSRGRMLALFTNKVRMADVADRIRIDGVRVLAQYRDGARHDLARELQRHPATILLGTKSFWEGVDVPGENLSVVVMEKIPFTSPGEPIYDARCEALEKSWFRRYALPLALLVLRQGFGRLIRTETDRGVVVLLDPGKESYTGRIRKSLPECGTVEGDEATVLEAIEKFFTKEPVS